MINAMLHLMGETYCSQIAMHIHNLMFPVTFNVHTFEVILDQSVAIELEMINAMPYFT